jgi:hypothetical protein
MYKLNFYVPVSHLSQVKDALFYVGVGRIGHYDQCCWQVLGEGQFRPLSDSNPFLGDQQQVEKVAEYRVEMVCASELIHSAVEALKGAHPYEEPAYNVVKLEEF